jgi:amidase
MKDYERYDGLGLAELVKTRAVTAKELLNAAVERIEARNPAVNAVVNKMYDRAEAAIAAGLPAGPFTGVPYALKDLAVYYAGTVTSSGSAFFRDAVADHDSEMVARMKRAGLVILGKTNTSEFGLSPSAEPRLFGPTRNPWNRERSAGGSSGGAAAAVAAGMLPIAHGTDGGGSIRIPAACCGLFGLKPTRARTPMGPDLGENWSGSSVGHAVTRSVRDSAALLDATAGPDVGDPYWAPPPRGPYLAEVGVHPGRLKIAVATKPWTGHSVDSPCLDAVASAAKLCADLGHRLEEASPPVDEELHAKARRIIRAANTRATLGARGKALGREVRPEDVETITWMTAEIARSVTAADYAWAIRAAHQIGRVIGRFFTQYDLLLTPTMCHPPLELGVLSMSSPDPDVYSRAHPRAVAFTAVFNTAGNPAMSVPLHWADGLPIGVQFAAPFGAEATLFRLAAQLEAAQPWAARRSDGRRCHEGFRALRWPRPRRSGEDSCRHA